MNVFIVLDLEVGMAVSFKEFHSEESDCKCLSRQSRQRHLFFYHKSLLILFLFNYKHSYPIYYK